MILSEFKAWFEGYTEGLEGAPTKAQFERIKEKVREIGGTPVSYPVFIDRYWQGLPRPNGYWTTYLSGGIGIGGANMGSIHDSVWQNSGSATLACNGDNLTNTFDSHSAMYALGKAEALQ